MLEAYLGGPVRYDGHVLLSLAPRLDPAAYLSAHWHHDRCGKRLKVFVFPHHVTEETKPTLIVPGTHRTWYYAEVAPVDVVSRFAPQYVHHVAASRGTRVTPLTGRAGGGFIFDTNALHRGAHGGNRSRTVVVLEFHAHGKVGGLRGHIDGPCPSTPRVLFDRPMDFERRFGRPGHPHYPTEDAASWDSHAPSLRGTTNFLAGVCGVSADSSDCARGASGAWRLAEHRMRTVQDCVDKCRGCARCNYISFSTSPLHDECSWYHTCDVANLQFFGSGPDYVTLDLTGVPKRQPQGT